MSTYRVEFSSGEPLAVTCDGYFFDGGFIHFYTENFWGRKKVCSFREYIVLKAMLVKR